MRNLIYRDPDPSGGGGGGAETPEQLKAKLAALETQSKNDRLVAQKAEQDKAAAQEKLRQIEDARQEEERKRLESGNEFKTLYETEKNTHQTTAAELKKLKEDRVKTDVRNAVKSEALAAGLKPDMMDMIEILPLDGVTPSFDVNPTTHEVKTNVHGAKEWVEALKSNKPSMFGAAPPPGMNNRPATPPAAPGSGSAIPSIKSSDLIKLKKENPAAYAVEYGKALHGQLLVVNG